MTSPPRPDAHSPLPPEQRQRIADLAEQGWALNAIAAEIGCTTQTARAWSPDASYTNTLTWQEALFIARSVWSGASYASIADALGRTRRCIAANSRHPVVRAEVTRLWSVHLAARDDPVLAAWMSNSITLLGVVLMLDAEQHGRTEP